MVAAATLGGWIATIALATDVAVLASGLVIADQATEVDPHTSHAVGERLRSRLEGAGAQEWDVRLLDRIDAETVSTKLGEAGAQITIPVLFVRGALNEMVTNAQTEAFVAEMPSAEFAEVADTDLLVTPERMEVFKGLLLEFRNESSRCLLPITKPDQSRARFVMPLVALQPA